jgi:hypothetical protein
MQRPKQRPPLKLSVFMIFMHHSSTNHRPRTHGNNKNRQKPKRSKDLPPHPTLRARTSETAPLRCAPAPAAAPPASPGWRGSCRRR